MTTITVRLYLIQIQPDGNPASSVWFTEGSAWADDVAQRWVSVLASGGIVCRVVAVDLAARVLGAPDLGLSLVSETETSEQPDGQTRPEPIGRLISTHRGRRPFGQPDEDVEDAPSDTAPAAPQGPQEDTNPEPGTDAP